ncbi:Mitochondrial carnitine/acylcarnitine carrier protein [Hondaea fermentalgiana]|uniref:Mitochondrial carnitine/acylcarnitine carrier protein n=1 Tax=Hondaea fermentalgiana TaxID=2315210 RepID=A0A2R5GTY4_9STRA|nr:Mitochondrial carnitine/acylcarnitine carrier protein [Hondaea fermentalgiana]|eukprot:GBG34310.1 Mitochondrial carnitine/acylcarnitine carrier protein [Hondaea fermentalgiana]
MSESAKAFLSGGFGGVCLVAVGHPLDTIKVKMQTSNEYSSMADCFRKIVAKDGPRGLFAGMAAPLAGITPIFAVYFWGFDLGKQIARVVEGKGPEEQISTAGIMFAGGFSAIPGSAVMVPGDRIKVILQTQGEKKLYNGPIDCAKKIYAEEGIRGLYKGTALTLLRDGPGSVAYYGAYELMKVNMPNAVPGGASGALSTIFCGGMAGVFNWIVAVPPDVLKSRFQTAPTGTYPGGIRQVATELIAKEGVASLYKGLAPALARAFPANAACFLGVETSKKVLNMYM